MMKGCCCVDPRTGSLNLLCMSSTSAVANGLAVMPLTSLLLAVLDAGLSFSSILSSHSLRFQEICQRNNVVRNAEAASGMVASSADIARDL